MPFNFNYGGVVNTGQLEGVIPPRDGEQYDGVNKGYVDEILTFDSDTDWYGYNVKSGTQIGVTVNHTDSEITFFIVENGVGTPELADDAVTTAKIGNNQVTREKLNTTGIPINTWSAADGNIDMNNHQIKGVAAPTADDDAASKSYVDGVAHLVQGDFGINVTVVADTDNISVDTEVIADTEWVKEYVEENGGYRGKIGYGLDTDSDILKVDTDGVIASQDWVGSNHRLDTLHSNESITIVLSENDTTATISVDTDIIADTDWVKTHVDAEILAETNARKARDTELLLLIEGEQPDNLFYTNIHLNPQTDSDFTGHGDITTINGSDGFTLTSPNANTHLSTLTLDISNVDTDVADSYAPGDYIKLNVVDSNDASESFEGTYSIHAIGKQTAFGTTFYQIQFLALAVRGDNVPTDAGAHDNNSNETAIVELAHSGTVALQVLDSDTSGIVRHAPTGDGTDQYFLGGDGTWYKTPDMGYGLDNTRTANSIWTVQVDTDVIADTDWVKQHIAGGETIDAGFGIVETNSTDSITLAVDTDVIADTEWVKANHRLNGVTGGNGITATDAGSDTINVAVDLAATSGLHFIGTGNDELSVDPDFGILLNANGVAVDTDVIADTEWVKAEIAAIPDAPSHDIQAGNGITVTDGGDDTDTISVRLDTDNGGLNFDSAGNLQVKTGETTYTDSNGHLKVRIKEGADNPLEEDSQGLFISYDTDGGLFFNSDSELIVRTGQTTYTDSTGVRVRIYNPDAGHIGGLEENSQGLRVDTEVIADTEWVDQNFLRFEDTDIVTKITVDPASNFPRVNVERIVGKQDGHLQTTEAHLVTGGTAGYGINFSAGQGDGNGEYSIDTDVIADTEWVKQHIAGGETINGGDGIVETNGTDSITLAVDTDESLTFNSSNQVGVDTEWLAEHVGGNNSPITAGLGIKKTNNTIAIDTDTDSLSTGFRLNELSDRFRISNIFGKRIIGINTNGSIDLYKFTYVEPSVTFNTSPRWDEPITSIFWTVNNDEDTEVYMDEITYAEFGDDTLDVTPSKDTEYSSIFSYTRTLADSEGMDTNLTDTQWTGQSSTKTLTYNVGVNNGADSPSYTSTFTWPAITTAITTSNSSGVNRDQRFDVVNTSTPMFITFTAASSASVVDTDSDTMTLVVDGTSHVDTDGTATNDSVDFNFSGLTIYHDSTVTATSSLTLVRPSAVQQGTAAQRTHDFTNSFTRSGNDTIYPTWVTSSTGLAQAFDTDTALGTLSNSGYATAANSTSTSTTGWQGGTYSVTAGAGGATMFLIVPSAARTGFRDPANQSLLIDPVINNDTIEIGHAGHTVTYHVYSFNVQANATLSVQEYN